MKRSKRIESILIKHFPNYNIDILDNSHLHIGHNSFNGEGETHLALNLKPNFGFKINRLKVHKKINFLLKEEFNRGLHSLEIKINFLK